MNAGDIATNDVVTVLESASLREALELLQTLEIRHLPVVRTTGELVGILSDRDIRNSGAPFTLLPERAGEDGYGVVEIMTTDVVTVNSETDLGDVIDLMLENRIGAVPVVDPVSNRVVGMVSYVDVLRGIRDRIEK